MKKLFKAYSYSVSPFSSWVTDRCENICRPFAFIRANVFTSSLQIAWRIGRSSVGRKMVAGPQYFPFQCARSPLQGEQHTRHRKPPSEHLKYRTATPQINLLSTRLSLPKWRQFKGEVEGWTKDTMMKLQWRPCHTWGLLVSLHSAIQATNSRESVSDQTPSQMVPVSRVSYYINTRHQLCSFAWRFSRDKDFII